MLCAVVVAALAPIGCGGTGSATGSEPAAAPPPSQATAPALEAGEHLFRGKVEVVDADGKRLTVLNENVEGWMAPMTMAYTTDNDAVFSAVEVGDVITAVVRDGDFQTLYGVKVAESEGSERP